MHGIQVNFSDKNDFYLSPDRYVCKTDQEVGHSENHPPGPLTAASSKTKKSFAGFCAACATKRKSTERESSCAFAKKRKSLTNLVKLYQSLFEKGVSEATLSSLLLLRSEELLARMTLLSLYSNKMKRCSVNLLQKLVKWSHPKKN